MYNTSRLINYENNMPELTCNPNTIDTNTSLHRLGILRVGEFKIIGLHGVKTGCGMAGAQGPTSDLASTCSLWLVPEHHQSHLPRTGGIQTSTRTPIQTRVHGITVNHLSSCDWGLSLHLTLAARGWAVVLAPYEHGLWPARGNREARAALP